MSRPCDLHNSTSMPYIITYGNKAMEVGYSFLDLTGYSKSEVTDKDIQYLCNNLLRLNADIYNLNEGQESFFIFTKNYEPREVYISVSDIQWLNGKLLIFKEKPNSRLDDKSFFLRRFINDSKSGVALYSVPELILLKANNTYLNSLRHALNTKENMFIGMSLKKLIPSWQESKIEEVFIKSIETNETLYLTEQTGVFGDLDESFWDNTLMPIDADGEVKFIVSILDDVSEKVHERTRKAERVQTIKQQKKYLETIIKLLSKMSLLAIVDKDGSYLKYSDNVNNYFPFTMLKGEVGETYKRGMYFDRGGNELSVDDLPASRVMRGETVSDFHFMMKTSDGDKYFITNGIPHYDECNHFNLGVLFTWDVTEQVKYQEALKSQQEKVLEMEKERNEALVKAINMKDEFLAAISHEFKTPLTVINAAVQTIEAIYGSQLSDHVIKHIRRIRMNSFRQLRLVNSLLDITRFSAGHFKVHKKNLDIVFLTKAITKSVELYAKQKNVELHFSTNIEFRDMAIDDEKYERILLNLLSNAIKFSQEGKSIYVDLICKSREAIIAVKDEGVGIPKNKQELIFERFGQVDSALTKQAEGTGIGLSLVKTLVTGLGGTITVESEEGKGSIFTVTLPITKLRQKEYGNIPQDQQNSRLVQAVAIEFADIYLE